MTRAVLVAVMEREIERWCREPMVWGKDDCALAIANIYRETFGYDPAARWRTGYSDRDGAIETLGRLGLGFALRCAGRKHGWHPVDPEKAQAGDVGLMMQNGFPVTVICRAPGWFIGRSESGATLVPAVNRALPFRSVKLCWAPI